MELKVIQIRWDLEKLSTPIEYEFFYRGHFSL